MSSATEHGGEGTIRRLFSSLRIHFRKTTGTRLDVETLHRLDAPAKLFIWQASGETDESRTFDTLREAVAHVPEAPEDRTFIITESGHIIRPAQIVKLKQVLESMR